MPDTSGSLSGPFASNNIPVVGLSYSNLTSFKITQRVYMKYLEKCQVWVTN